MRPYGDTPTATPFAILLTPNDKYGRVKTDLYKNYLRRLEFNPISASGLSEEDDSNQSVTMKSTFRVATATMTMDLLDPTFYTIESIIYANPDHIEIWFGWVDGEGRVIEDIRHPIQFTVIEPNITPAGNALHIEFTTLSVKQESSVLDIEIKQTQNFLAGGLKAREEADEDFKSRIRYYKANGTRKGELPQPDKNTYYFERASDIVSFICDQAGIPANIDETPIADIRMSHTMTNQSAFSFIQHLAYTHSRDPSSTSPDSFYKVWFRDGVLYFKDEKSYTDVNDSRLTLEYMAKNDTTMNQVFESKIAKNRKALILSMNIKLNNQVGDQGAALAGVRAVGHDPITKRPTGIHVSKSTGFLGSGSENKVISDSRAAKILGISDALQEEGADDLSVAAFAVKKQGSLLKKNKIYAEDSNDAMFNMFIMGRVTTLLDKKGTAKKNNIGGDNQERAYIDYARSLATNGQADGLDDDAVSAILESDESYEKERNLKLGELDTNDLTHAGKTIVQPYYDSRTAAVARSVYSNVARAGYEIDVTMLGDMSIWLQDEVDIIVNLPHSSVFKRDPGGPKIHYSTGVYIVERVSHIIDREGFTTALTMKRIRSIPEKVEPVDELDSRNLSSPGGPSEASQLEKEPENEVWDNEDSLSYNTGPDPRFSAIDVEENLANQLGWDALTEEGS